MNKIKNKCFDSHIKRLVEHKQKVNQSALNAVENAFYFGLISLKKYNRLLIVLDK